MTADGPDPLARRTAERAARESYGRLLAFLVARSRNIAASEDALSDAFRRAIETWPLRGIPDNPQAWLLTTARRRLMHVWRHERVKQASEETLLLMGDEETEPGTPFIPDERLKLMFVCAHPAIDAAAQTPLMLQTVLGLDAARIASAFLTSPATMSQRLVRAKAKIRNAGIAFELPEASQLEARVESVLAAIYGAFGTGWDDVTGADPRRKGLADEAIWLGRVLVAVLPDEPEAHGLLALMLHCHARSAARRTADGRFIPLDQQDPARWDRAMTGEAEDLIAFAARAGRFGRYQLEAAIQSVHASRVRLGHTNWIAIAMMYDALVAAAPTIGTYVNRAVAVARATTADRGLTLLSEIPETLVAEYQPFWVARATLLREAGRAGESADAFRKAIGLTEEEGLRRYLMDQSRSP